MAEWIAEGAPGASDPWLDPVSQNVAGYSATLHNGCRLEVPPCPRRSVGPDLFALLFGMKGRIGKVDGVYFQARKSPAPTLNTKLERNPTIASDEAARIEEVCVALATSESP